MSRRIVVLGGGRGVASVLHAVRDDPLELTVIVTIVDDAGSSDEMGHRSGGPAFGDMRRSLTALAGEESVLGRAFARPLTINRLGRHPLGNLVIRSLVEAFGDVETATAWLGGQLGISARVLPASVEPVRLLVETGDELICGKAAIVAARVPILRLRFEPEHPESPPAALEAIGRADWVLLAPGSLFTSTLAATALPEVASAIAGTASRVLWICNLEPQPPETARMTAVDQLAALRGHGVRVDIGLYDPRGTLPFTGRQLALAGLPALSRPLRGGQPGQHDPVLLRGALHELFSNDTRGIAQRALSE